MKKNINIRIVLLALLSILATMLFVTLAFNKVFENQMMDDLKLYAKFIENYESDKNIYDLAPHMEADGLRITLLNNEGKVLLDTAANIDSMDNHADRPEIVSAVQEGEGMAIRMSDTLDRSTYYYAIRLDDGNILRVSRDAQSLFSFFSAILPSMIVIAAVLTVMSFIIAHFLTKSLMRPIEQLAENLDHYEEITCYEELEPFVKMIQEQHRDILKSAKMRQEFTANVTHELKTPLTSISGYAELIETGMASEKDTVRFAQGIHTNANRLLTLINDIIRLSELDSAEEEMTLEKLDLYEMAATCVEMLELSAQKHQVNICLEGERCFIYGNKMMIEELLYNLTDNAIRYNNLNGSVVVNVHAEKDQVILMVKDTGIGIPKEHQERIFERFYRVDKSRSKSTGGTGLGLAIVKHIIVKHGAQLEMDSDVGKGTCMKVVFTNKGR